MKPATTIKDLQGTACAHLNAHLFTPPEAIKKKSKYSNVKVEFDGFIFDSIKERNRYIELRMLLTAGEVANLRLQVAYELNEGGSHSLKYVADFVYLRNGQEIVEDVKGFRTAVYRKKRRLMLQIYGIEILET